MRTLVRRTAVVAALLTPLCPSPQPGRDRDLLSHSGVRLLLVLEGTNDVGIREATAAQVIAGYQQTIARAHANGVKVIGATLTPSDGSTRQFPTYASAQTEADWQTGSETRAIGHLEQLRNQIKGDLDDLAVRGALDQLVRELVASLQRKDDVEEGVTVVRVPRASAPAAAR